MSSRAVAQAQAYPRSLDVSSPRSVANFVQYAEETLGGVDLLVNNAAMCEEGWSRETVQQTLRTNVVGPAALSQALLPGMMRRRRGHVICISSGDGELVYLSTSMQRELQSARSSRDVPRPRAAVLHHNIRLPTRAWPTPAYAVSRHPNALTRLSAAVAPPMDAVYASVLCAQAMCSLGCSIATTSLHAGTPCPRAPLRAMSCGWRQLAC